MSGFRARQIAGEITRLNINWGRSEITHMLMAISTVLTAVDIYARLKVETVQTEPVERVCDDRPLMSGTKVECR